MHKRFFLLNFIMLLLISAAIPAHAARPLSTCTCAADKLERRWDASVAVIAGTVTDIKVVDEYVNYGSKDLPVEVTLQVDDVYKGKKIGKTFTLFTSITKVTCTGHPFELGKKYLIFAYERQDAKFERWSLYEFPTGTYDVGGLCGGTQLFDETVLAQELADIKARQDIDAKKKNIFGQKKN